MTTYELRDWHAREAGYTRHLSHWHQPKDWGDAAMPVGVHPFPPTIDGAASAMPKGWQWTRTFAEGDYWAWVAVLVGGLGCRVVVRDTGDEIHDRYLLAKLAKEAMNAQSR